MKDNLKSKLKERYGDSPSLDQQMSFAFDIAYLCRMYWLQRTDKIHEDDYELYRCMTNELAHIHPLDMLPETYKPKYGSEPLFSNKCSFKLYSHTMLERQIADKVLEIITIKPAPQKKQSIFSIVKKLFS